jgi:hypothetical protein
MLQNEKTKKTVGTKSIVVQMRENTLMRSILSILNSRNSFSKQKFFLPYRLYSTRETLKNAIRHLANVQNPILDVSCFLERERIGFDRDHRRCGCKPRMVVGLENIPPKP